jgi:hypothetical protein
VVSPEWRSAGMLLRAPLSAPWARSHAALPTPVPDGHGGYDVYFSPRDADGRAHVARASVTVEGDRLHVTALDERPVLGPGRPGAFDESGVTASCVVQADRSTLLYYTGWTLGVTVPFYFYAGLAIRTQGEECFRRVSEAPLLERTGVDPFLTASPWVLRDEGRWRMWYVSSPGWRIVDGGPRHLYHVCYAESDDGIGWRREGTVCLDFADEREYAMGRPCVVRDADRYGMWFAVRGDAYRLAYAESDDGLVWRRDDAALGTMPVAEDWEAEMRAYPAILDHAGRRFMLYNGNGYGRTGIGYAVARPSGG